MYDMCKLKIGTSSRYLISFLPFYFLLYTACHTFNGKNFPNGLALEELSQYKAEPRFDRSLGKKKKKKRLSGCLLSIDLS